MKLAREIGRWYFALALSSFAMVVVWYDRRREERESSTRA